MTTPEPGLTSYTFRNLILRQNEEAGRTTNGPPTTCDECVNNGLKGPVNPFRRNREIPQHVSGHQNPTTTLRTSRRFQRLFTKSSLLRNSRQGDARPSSTTSSGGHSQKETSPDCLSLARLDPFAHLSPGGPPPRRTRLSSRTVGLAPTTYQGEAAPALQR